jgi:integrase/recombinase XerD
VRYVVNNHVVLSRPPEGPLAPYIGSFAQSLREHGYARQSIYRHVLLAACYSCWLKQKRVAVRNIRCDHAPQYLRYRARRVPIREGDAAALRHVIELLRAHGVLPCEKEGSRRLSPIDRCLKAYRQYLLDVRAVTDRAIVLYVPFVRNFLQHRFGRGPVVLARLCAADVVRFVRWQVPRLHLKRAKLMTAALRSFLGYARYCGEVTLDLAAAVPVVANWSMSSIPRAIAADQVGELLASIDRSHAPGRRDYAILLLLARLGLRSSEVAFLELDDIDWQGARLCVRRTAAPPLELPLSNEVGKAIAAYLRHDRPSSSSRRVFLRARAPIRGFRGPGGVGSIVRHALDRAGVDAPTRGAHQFRHGLASEMLRRGASLREIGELLGHRDPQTTTIYAKVDLEALRTLVLPWPGGAR